MQEVYDKLRSAEQELNPQFNALRAVMGALKGATRLAAEEKADALPMKKALTKLETAAAGVDNPALNDAVAAFAAVTQTALDNLAFDFAKDLRDAFAARGDIIEGRPPILSVGLLTFNINIAARKGQWLYGKEPLTKPIPLSLTGILKAYDRQVKRIVTRSIDSGAVVAELQKAWQDCLDKRSRRPREGRVSVIEAHSQMTLNRQNNRFWNAPSRQTFKDYERVLYVRDLALLNEAGVRAFKLGVATKSQVDQASKCLWLPTSALDGQYYSEITFD